MKRREYAALLLIVALMAGIITAGATMTKRPGSASDPLLSLAWIEGTFLPNTVEKAGATADGQLGQLSEEIRGMTPEGAELRVKEGDTLRLESGSTLICLAGAVDLASTGEIVDLTAGTATSQTEAVLNRRYLVAEDSTGTATVRSGTAVVRLNGPYEWKQSGSTDYNAMATALKTLGLFKGTDTPYGTGYDLEKVPTRIQGLIMFLRLLGEEKAALSYTGGSTTFPDVPEWATSYVAYAYEKHYTKGKTNPNSQNQVWFGTNDSLTARDYMTFLLRALEFTEGNDFNWMTAVSDAQQLSVLTAGETTLLTNESESFLRAQVVYLSWYALDAKLAGKSTTLADRLTSGGAIESSTLVSARKTVNSQRL